MMSTHMYTILAGSSGRSVLVCGEWPNGLPATGLDPASIRVAYARDDGSAARSIPRPVQEIDAALTPGVYQVWLPDAALAVGATRAVIVMQHPEARFDPVDIDLVMYDPQDSVRLGMTSLGPEGRIDALRGAFPQLSALELRERAALGEDNA